MMTGRQALPPRPDAAELDPALLAHLAHSGWTMTQIAAFVDRDRATVTRVLRDASHTPAPRGTAAPLTIRLTRDAQRLQIMLPANGLPTPTAVLLEQIQEHCARHRIALTLTQEGLAERLQTCVYGSWLTIADAVRPTPPTPERFRVLVPVAWTGCRRRRDQAPAAPVVRQGTVLAQRVPGAPGQPGRDLLGREVPPRQPRPAHLPLGQNTVVSADGGQLVAACDGRVVMEHLRLHVIAATIHEGDLTAEDGVLRAAGDVIVTGSVREEATLLAEGDVAIHGSVQSAQITSASGDLTVRGAVSGTARHPSVLQAGRSITCERVLHSTLRAGGNLVVRGDAHHSRLEPAGDLYLSQALERTLFDVQLRVGGGVRVPVAPLAPQADAPTERRHTRVTLTLEAHLAVYGAPPLAFTPCVIEDLSPGGARCRLSAPLEPESPGAETLVQLKVVLPGQEDQIIVLARVAHVASPDTLGLAFAQITEHDADQVMQYYLQGLRDARTHKRGGAGERRSAR